MAAMFEPRPFDPVKIAMLDRLIWWLGYLKMKVFLDFGLHGRLSVI